MRLKPEEVDAIKETAAETFGDSAVVRLFGSRIDDAGRGGDIDLHIEVDAIADEGHVRWLFEHRLFQRIDPQKVDVVLTIRGGTPRGFERIAYRDGIVL
ncbi:nucleotidyltransferase domain-containing protein [Sphingomonas ginsenosidivorax]|uniref:Nucleotidyltransferase domain-containing protein n=1 Tax=Sphingomonas ginsenosidivorax TaxID=862135 RepID=A0A5C6UJN9_9SPHN|nr:nucleotidyltransferase domain-containing protein [Sphingomonas ginsenosidivorax]